LRLQEQQLLQEEENVGERRGANAGEIQRLHDQHKEAHEAAARQVTGKEDL